MPELPDVEIWRRYAQVKTLHQTITRAELRAPEMLLETSPRRLRETLVGRRFVGTRRHGKHLFLRLTSRGWLALHFGMTGTLVYARHPRSIPTHTRLLIHFAKGCYLAFDCQRKLGMIAVVTDPDAFVRRRRLGLDALSANLTEGHLHKILARKRACIKAALLDQHVIAGIGNIYADEILFQARIDPRAQTGCLHRGSLHSLAGAMRRVLRLAIARRANPHRLPGGWLLPRRSTSEHCPRCGNQLTRLRISGRTCYFCERCQANGRQG